MFFYSPLRSLDLLIANGPLRANGVLYNGRAVTATDCSSTLPAAATNFGYRSTSALNLQSDVDRRILSRSAVITLQRSSSSSAAATTESGGRMS